MKQKLFNVTSEIGKLKKVLVHRPGLEIERLTPELMKRLLFDDIPFLELAQKEHDAFVEVLKNHDVKVVYLEKLIAETIKNKNIRKKFIEEFMDEGNVSGKEKRYLLKEYFSGMNELQLVQTLMSGIKKDEIPNLKNKSLSDMVNKDYPFILDPMPNLYFTRDPIATIGNGVSLNRMKVKTRNRETIFYDYIFKYHPIYNNTDISKFYNRNNKTPLEGGDILILSDKLLAIGISERTSSASIEKVARNLFSKNTTYKTILAFMIPSKRAFMHLDTVFTMVDFDKFTIHAGIEEPLKLFSITKVNKKEFKFKEEKAKLSNILKKYLNLNNVTLIKCAGGRFPDADREQWSDGSNTLAIAPGEVIVYKRNYVTNNLLKQNGIKTHIISCSELSRGRGGPRCMSMPLIRENI